MKRTLSLILLIGLFSLAAFADIAQPDKTPNREVKPKAAKQIDTYLQIRLDRDAKEARLLIPKKFAKELRAALDEMDGGEDSNAALTDNAGGSFTRTQTIVSGLFLSLAMVFGGMWFVRSGKAATTSGKALIILAVVTGAGSTATLVYANVGPPPSARSITNQIFSKAVNDYGFGGGKIKLELTDETSPKLIVPNPQATPATDE